MQRIRKIMDKTRKPVGPVGVSPVQDVFSYAVTSPLYVVCDLECLGTSLLLECSFLVHNVGIPL